MAGENWGRAHDTGIDGDVLLALLRVLPVLAGSKACRKVGLDAVLLELRAQIPDNGVGPLVVERRDALLFLESNCRQCTRCRKSLIGPMRRYLARHGGDGFSDWAGLAPETAARAALLIAERAEAAESLADFCRRCGRCPEDRILR